MRYTQEVAWSRDSLDGGTSSKERGAFSANVVDAAGCIKQRRSRVNRRQRRCAHRAIDFAWRKSFLVVLSSGAKALLSKGCALPLLLLPPPHCAAARVLLQQSGKADRCDAILVSHPDLVGHLAPARCAWSPEPCRFVYTRPAAQNCLESFV